MNRQTLGALIALNIALFVALLVVTASPQRAEAQLGVSRAQYIMLTGDVVGRKNEAVVYVVDLTNARIASLIYSSATNRVEVIAGRNMTDDFAAARSGASGR